MVGLVAEQLQSIPVGAADEGRVYEELLKTTTAEVLALRMAGIRASIEQGMARLRSGQDESEGDVERLMQKVITQKQVQNTLHSNLEALKKRLSAPSLGLNGTQVELQKVEAKLQSLSSFIREHRSQSSSASASITLIYQRSTNRQHYFQLSNLKYRLQTSLSLQITLEEAQDPVTIVPLHDLPASGETLEQVSVDLVGSLEAVVVTSERKRCSNLVVFQAT